MDVLMPQLGETVAEGKISKWFVKAGDAVKPGDNLFEIETDKVSMEVPAIAAGTLHAINVQAGEIAPVGAVVAIIQGSGEALAPRKPQPPLTPAKAGVPGKEDKQERKEAARAPATPMEPFREVRTPERNYGPARLPGGPTVTPLARRLAGEAGIDLTKLKGSGPHGRIVAADIAGAQPTKGAAATLAQAAAQIVLTADVAIGQALALCEQANAAQNSAIELIDVVAKAWALALRRAGLPDGGIALQVGATASVLSAAASQSLTTIAAARRDPADGAAASSAIAMPAVPGIVSVAGVLRAPHTTLLGLGLGAPRRAPIEAADGDVKFIDAVTVTLSCDAGALDAAGAATLLAAFKGYVEQPVTMIV
ncbi:MAG: E3 binding domain-containing protein [Alphaproteobacteria bacterium]|nr:E3 binding domain-containing protein [Alphaproteobacteria bacterium]